MKIKRGKVTRKKTKAIKVKMVEAQAGDTTVAVEWNGKSVKVKKVITGAAWEGDTGESAESLLASAHSPDMSVVGVLREPPSGPDSFRALSHTARRAKGKWWKDRKRITMEVDSLSTRCNECLQPIIKGEKYRQGDGVSAHDRCVKSLLQGGDPAHVQDIVKKVEGKESSGYSVGRFLMDTLARHNPNVAHVREGIRKMKHEDLVDRFAMVYCHILGLSGTERI